MEWSAKLWGRERQYGVCVHQGDKDEGGPQGKRVLSLFAEGLIG